MVAEHWELSAVHVGASPSVHTICAHPEHGFGQPLQAVPETCWHASTESGTPSLSVSFCGRATVKVVLLLTLSYAAYTL
jgi:hypothetical protein